MYQRFAYRIVHAGLLARGRIDRLLLPAVLSLDRRHCCTSSSATRAPASGTGTEPACWLARYSSFRITRTFAGFRWGLVAAVTTLAVFVLGTAQYLIGQGLGEISSAGLLSMAALCAIEQPASAHCRGDPAGMLATLAFYTRLNNLIMAAGVALFALPLDVSVRDSDPAGRMVAAGRLAHRDHRPLSHRAWPVFFAWRTWHYTGVFSLFYGTQRYIVSRSGSPDAPTQRSMQRGSIHSVMLVLTVNDPPRFDLYALPILAGAIDRGAEHCRASPRFRDLPAAAVLFFFAVDCRRVRRRRLQLHRRFSLHVMPITSALTVCAVGRLLGDVRHGL